MKHITAFFLALALSLSIASGVQAQSSETIWMSTSTGATAFKTGEIVSVWVSAVSVTPVQGFTFQIRYDPACLKPVNAASPIPGMNGLSLPQTVGLVDASFASTVPQSANGVLAEVRFETLGGCQTNLILESAALAVRNAQGFAAPLPGVKLGETNIMLVIDSATGTSPEQSLSGTPLALDPGTDLSTSANSGSLSMLMIALGVIIVIGVLGLGIYKVIEKITPAPQDKSSSSGFNSRRR